MNDSIRRREVIALAIIFVFGLSTILWARSLAVVFTKQFPSRLANFRIWPDARTIREKALLERVNIHIPDFEKLAQAFHTPENRKEIWESCTTYHQDIIEVMPGRYDALLVNGVCEYYSGHLSEAERSLLKTVVLKPDSFWAHYDLGILYFNHGAYAPAVKELKEAIERSRTYNMREWLGSKVIADICRVDKSQDTTKTFYRAYLDAFKAIAAGCILLNDQVGAIDYANAGRRSSPGDEDFLLILGVALLRSGRVTEAVEPLKEAIRLYPSSGAAYFFLGLALKEGKNENVFMLVLKKSRELGFDPDRFLSGLKFPLRIY